MTKYEPGYFYTTKFINWRNLCLSGTSIKVYDCIVAHMNVRTGESFPGIERIRGKIKKESPTTVFTALRELKKAKLIKIKKGDSINNIYEVLNFNLGTKKLETPER